MKESHSKKTMNGSECEKSTLIRSITAEGKDLNEEFVSFIEQFYVSFPQDEIEKAGMLLCIARDMYKFLECKQKDETVIRIFNPTVKDDGWQSGFTIIQILSDDMPFLVDSFTEEIKHNGCTIEQRINTVLATKRDQEGKIKKIYSTQEKEGKTNESLMYFAINKIGKNVIDDLCKKLAHVSRLVGASVCDWQQMSAAVDLAVENLSFVKNDKKFNIPEIKTFLRWMQNNNFVFLSYQEYTWNNQKLNIDHGKTLGTAKIEPLCQELSCLEDYKSYIYITRSNSISKVHRRVDMDCIRLKVLDKSGLVIGERRFFGLFTSTVYYQDVRSIPIIRRKLEEIERKTKFVRGAHNNKTLVAIIQDFPRVELLHISIDDLYKTCMGMISLSIKPRFKLFIHRDPVGNFIRFIIFIPNSQFSMRLGSQMKQYLIEKFSGAISNEYTVLGDSGLVRLQLILKSSSLDFSFSDEDLELDLARMTRDWDESLKDVLNEKINAQDTEKIYLGYIKAFSKSYKETFSACTAYSDIKKLESIRGEKSIDANLYKVSDEHHLKIYFPAEKLQLYDLIPVIENMSMRVIEHYSYKVKKASGMWIHHFVLRPVTKTLLPLEKFKDKFESALIKILNKEIEDDHYNSLIALAGLDAREVLLLRIFGNYAKQICFKYSPEYIQSSLAKQPEACAILIKLFHARFYPGINNEEREEKSSILKGKIESILAKTDDLVDDKIVRTFLELCFATVRTNYYLKKEYVSLKISSNCVSDMPLPKPFVEVYVYSNKFEGVHLRGGKVARGGIRWSDRTQDFRTEVLGLMKAQMPKNATIVPVGSKGGFVLKEEISEQNKRQETAIESYKDFLRGILDVTDNIVDGVNKHPENIVFYDEFDPYLVVAADKGTATFSNYANEISKEYNFWLLDAFASGGSSGYDHKKLAITSSGAWVSMQLRFWERFGNVKKSPFTVVGIGDMSGDVFGNGMLLSDKIQLVAAFNHVNIFIDPKPKSKDSFQERKRLFKMNGSTWESYNKDLISEGGGIFTRSSKFIKLSTQIKDLFNIKEDKISPNHLIRLILCAKVDVMWNGGIGTYIKSCTESNECVGDKANDLVRVNGKDVKAKIIVEGGNLGCTQLGRIEYSKNGGLINTDFIDNCAAVCCSDMEVNIKIAFSSLLHSKKLTLSQRDKMLFEMEKSVTDHILSNINQAQAAILMLEDMWSRKHLEQYQLLLNKLERIGSVDRKVEFLPTNEQIKKMFADGTSFARPQIAVLISYAKMHLYDKILASDIPDNSFFDKYLISYFPVKMQKEYRAEIMKHPLRREIIATYIANTMVNKVGCTFINSVVENTGFSTKEVVRVLVTVYEVYKLEEIFEEFMSSIGKFDVEIFKEIVVEISNFISQTVYWLLRNYPQPMKIGLAVDEFSKEIENIYNKLSDVLDSASLEEYGLILDGLVKNGVPSGFAKKIASLRFLGSALAIIQTSNNLRFYGKMQIPTQITAKIYFHVGDKLYLTTLRKMALEKCENGSYWQRISVRTLSDELYDKQMFFAAEVAKHLEDEDDYIAAFDFWRNGNIAKLKRYNDFFNDMKASGELDVSKFVMLAKRLDSIVTN